MYRTVMHSYITGPLLRLRLAFFFLLLGVSGSTATRRKTAARQLYYYYIVKPMSNSWIIK